MKDVLSEYAEYFTKLVPCARDGNRRSAAFYLSVLDGVWKAKCTGCEDANGSNVCKDCMIRQAKVATDELNAKQES